MLGRKRDLRRTDVRPDYTIEVLGKIQSCLTGAGAAIPGEPAAGCERGEISISARGYRGRNAEYAAETEEK